MKMTSILVGSFALLLGGCAIGPNGSTIVIETGGLGPGDGSYARALAQQEQTHREQFAATAPVAAPSRGL